MIIIPALLGLVLCLLNAAGADIFCLTDGCAIYASYSLFGLSIYSGGAAGFAVILVLALLSGKSGFGRSLLFWTIFIGLILDMVLLAWQLMYWPCSSCLAVAVLLGGAGAGFWLKFPHLHRRLLKGVLLVWVVMLVPAAVAAGKEILVSPWMIYGSPKADIQVFFSPTCPACSTEVAKLLKSAELDRVAFYPVAKNERDVRLVAALLRQDVAVAQDLGKLFQIEPDATLEPSLELRWQLARNKMVLARHGAQMIPFIVSPTVMEMPQQSFDRTFHQPNLFEAFEPKGCGPIGPPGLSCE